MSNKVVVACAVSFVALVAVVSITVTMCRSSKGSDIDYYRTEYELEEQRDEEEAYAYEQQQEQQQGQQQQGAALVASLGNISTDSAAIEALKKEHVNLHKKLEEKDKESLEAQKKLAEAQQYIEDLKKGSSVVSSSDIVTSERKKFMSSDLSVPFAQYVASFDNQADGPALRSKLSSQIINTLSEFMIIPPRQPIQAKCSTPPPLPEPSSITCAAYKTAFTGKKRDRPARVAHMIQFGFEVDLLEIHLRELYDVVDVFFILEATRTHLDNIIKPLLWERVRNQDRFKIFADKVVHIVLDDVQTLDKPANKKTNIWYLERLQERRRFEAFLEWNSKQALPFQSDDLVGFGDTDEVASRTNVHLLKYCDFATDSIDIGIWFGTGDLTSAFRGEYPVHGHPYSLGDPSFFKLGTAQRLYESRRGGGGDDVPVSRQRGKSGTFLLGGMHMTRHRYLPYLLLQFISCTECGMNLEWATKFSNLIKAGDVLKLEKFMGDVWRTDGNVVPRMKSLSELSDAKDMAVVPWFLSCDTSRYPYWIGGHDTRLDN